MATTIERLTIEVDANTRRLDRGLQRATTTTSRALQRMERATHQTGGRAGSGFADRFGVATRQGMTRAATTAMAPMQTLPTQATRIGGAAGSGLVGGLTAAASASRLARSGSEAASGWARGAQGAVRASHSGFASAATMAVGGLTQGVSRAAGGVTDRMRSLGGSAGSGFSGALTGGLAGLSGAFLGVQGMVAGLGAVTASTLLRISGDFEKAMNGVAAVTGATGQSFDQLRNKAKELGSTTQFSATEAATAMEFLGMAGWDTRQIMSGLGDVLNMAAAGNIDLARAADIASNVMSGFRLEADEASRVSDTLAAAAANANVSIPMLGESMSKVAPLAADAGISMEETAAAIGFLGDAGIQGETAGTAMAAAISRLRDTTGPASSALTDLGVQVTDSEGNLKSLADILRELESAGADGTDMIRIFGQDHGPKLTALLAEGGDALEEFAGELEDASGAAEDMASTRMRGLVGALTTVRSAFEGLIITIGDMGILQGATRIAEGFGAGIQRLTGFLEEHQSILKPIITAVGVFAAVAGGLIGVLLAGKAIIAGVGAVLAAVTSPIWLVVGAVAALATGMVLAWKHSQTFRGIVTAVWERIRRAAARVRQFFEREVWPVLIDGWREFRQAAQPHVERIGRWLRALRDNSGEFAQRWGFVWDAVTERLAVAREFIGSWVQMATRQFSGWIDVITGILSGDWGKVWDGAREIFTARWSHLLTAAKIAVKLLWGALKFQMVQLPSAFGRWVADVAPVIVDKARTEWIPAFVGWTREMQTKLHEKILDLADSFGVWLTQDVPDEIRANLPVWTREFTGWAGGLWGKLREELAEVGPNLRGWITTRAEELPTDLQEWTNEFTGWAGGLWGKLREKIDEYGLQFTLWMEQFAEELPEKLDAWTLKITEWVEGVAEKLPEKLDNWSQEISQWIIDFAEELPEKLDELTQKFVDWATGAPDEAMGEFEKSFDEKDTIGTLENKVEHDWGPRLLLAFARAIGTLIVSIPGMVARVGVALIQGFIQIILELGATIAQRFLELGVEAERIWGEIKDAVVNKAGEMASGVTGKIGDLYDNTVGKLVDLAKEVVGNSIIPDMVSDVISETGKLSGGVGGKLGAMNTTALAKTTAMATAMVARITAMATQVQSSISQMGSGATRLFTALSSVLLRSMGRLAQQMSRLLGSLATGFVAGFTRMATQTQRVFTQMTARLLSVTRTLTRDLDRAFARMGDSIVRGFERTVAGVDRAWRRLRTVTAAPVRYVINPVVNRGLRGVWNTVAAKVPGLSAMPAVRGFERGGMIDLTGGGKLTGFSSRDNRIAAVRDGEGVLTPEATSSLGGRSFVDAANTLGRRAGRLLLEGFATGGIVGLTNTFRGRARNDFDGKGGVVAAGNRVLNGILSIVGSQHGRRQDLPGTAYHSTKEFSGKIMAQIRKHREDLEIGKGAKAVVKLAEKSVGRYPEVPPGSNRNAITNWYGMNGAPWCAMFISWLFNRTKNSKALKGAARTAWTGDYYTSGMRRVSEAQKRPADIAVYGTRHVNMVTDPTRFRIGGNESNNVSRGARSGGALFRPAFARGGMVDPEEFVWQDHRWEPQPPDHIDALRQIFDATSFDQGGYLPPGFTLAYNGTGRPEPVGAEPIRIIIDLEGGDEELKRRVRKITRVEGGGNVQVAFGSGGR